MTKQSKRILSVTIRRMINEDPDTSWLGEYSNSPSSEFSIDRAHSEDCASVRADIQIAKDTLEHVQQTIGDLHNAILAQYNGTLANEKLDSERDALDAAYDEVGQLFDELDECDCGERGDMRRGEYRYFNPSSNYKDCEPEEIRKYTRQDYERMESLNAGQWCFIGIGAEARILLPSGTSQVISKIQSGGLWGIESDSDKSYLAEVEQEELSALRTELKALGFSTRAISTAFKQIERKEE
jgi:hypothetical protein